MAKDYLEENKEKLLCIKKADEHWSVYEWWLDFKATLDYISKFAPLTNEYFNIDNDVNLFPEKLKKIANHVLFILSENGVSKYDVLPTTLGDADQYCTFDRNKLKIYSDKVNNLCDFIKKDGIKRFPNLYIEDKVKLYISSSHGIYNNKNSIYPLNNTNKRFKLLTYLKDGKKDGKFLAELLYNNDQSLLSKEKNIINESVINKCKVNFKLISRPKTGGYILNSENYNIEFIS